MMFKYLCIGMFAVWPLFGQLPPADPPDPIDKQEQVPGQLPGQLLDELPQDTLSLEPPETFVGESRITLADESDEPDSGNWYEKLRWWKEAKWLYTIDIRNTMEQLNLFKEEYDEKQKEIFSRLGSYSQDLPLKRQAAVHVIDDLIADLEKRQEEIAQEQTRTQARQDTEETTELEEHKKMLDELKKQFNDFNTLTQRLKQVFEVVVPKQIKDCNDYDAKALEAYENIEQTLDDKKAHAYFDEVENSLENINELMSYLKGPLWLFVDRAWVMLQQVMPKITKSIDDLEEKGVVVRPLTPEEKAQMAQLEKARKERRARKAAERKAARERMARSWWKKMFSAIGSFFVKIGSGTWYGVTRPFVWIGNLFTKAEPVKAPKPSELKKSDQKQDQQETGPAPQTQPSQAQQAPGAPKPQVTMPALQIPSMPGIKP